MNSDILSKRILGEHGNTLIYHVHLIKHRQHKVSNTTRRTNSAEGKFSMISSDKTKLKCKLHTMEMKPRWISPFSPETIS